MPDPEVSCWWAWNGIAWVPAIPHECPPYHVCRMPNYEGAYIGQYAQEVCVELVEGKMKRAAGAEVMP